MEKILDEQLALFKKMPAAQNFHHSYTSGLLEHVWSMTRIAELPRRPLRQVLRPAEPPFNRVVIAATILHDIGKLRELEYHPVEAKYTKEGRLIGHVLMGRDMVREAASRIEGFPEELLLRLEHAILAHHGKREFGSPVLPQTHRGPAGLVYRRPGRQDEYRSPASDGSADGRRLHRADLRARQSPIYKGMPEEVVDRSLPPLSLRRAVRSIGRTAALASSRPCVRMTLDAAALAFAPR